MGQCTSKSAYKNKQQTNQSTNNQNNINNKNKSNTNPNNCNQKQKMRQDLAKYDDKVIDKRQSRIKNDQMTQQQLKNKLQLIKAGKYEQAGIKSANAYFEMVRIQKQIQLIRLKITKSKQQINKYQQRKTYHK